jgi:hypothetical protein
LCSGLCQTNAASGIRSMRIRYSDSIFRVELQHRAILTTPQGARVTGRRHANNE